MGVAYAGRVEVFDADRVVLRLSRPETGLHCASFMNFYEIKKLNIVH